MSDEDIQKELEQHIRLANYVDSSYCDIVSVDLLQETIDFINRQQADIERLKKKYDRAMDNLKAVLKERAGEQNV